MGDRVSDGKLRPDIEFINHGIPVCIHDRRSGVLDLEGSFQGLEALLLSWCLEANEA